MSGVLYNVQEWRDSLEEAQIADSTGDAAGLVQFPLAVWLCRLPLVQIRRDHSSVDPFGLMYAALDLMTAPDGSDPEDSATFAPREFMKTLRAFGGETSSDFEALCHEYASEQGVPEHLFPSMFRDMDSDDHAAWYLDHAAGEGVTYREDPAGGTAYWFNLGQL